MNATSAAALLLSALLTAGGDGTPTDASRASATEGTTTVPVSADRAARSPRAPSGRASAARMVTAEELKRLAHGNVGYALRTLRPHWFSTRGSNAQPVAVFLDGVLLEDEHALARLPARSVIRATRLTGIEVSRRFGVSLASGAILVETR
jgi:hypothetical protein